jgi:hypothetical protein
MMPIAIFIWLIGWTLICLDSKQPIKTKTPMQKELAFAILLPEPAILA